VGVSQAEVRRSLGQWEEHHFGLTIIQKEEEDEEEEKQLRLEKFEGHIFCVLVAADDAATAVILVAMAIP